MSRKVSTVIAVALASMLPGLAKDAMADGREFATLYRQASLDSGTRFIADTSNSLLPKRWCLETATRSQALHRKSDQAPGDPWGLLEFAAADFDFATGFFDRSAFNYRLAELHGDRLVTFWKGDSVGIFLGISRGGFITLRIAQ
jgi:hypothetical protein